MAAVKPTTFNYVLCPRFHGATMFSLLLNNHSEISGLGDNTPRTEYDQTCGCSKAVSACEFWQAIDRKFVEYRQRPPRRMYPRTPYFVHDARVNKGLVRLASFAALLTSNRLWTPAGRRYAEFYLAFVDAVNEYNNTSIFVNGGKMLESALSLKSILGDRAKINIIHLVRDPRGFHCSERNRRNLSVEASAINWRRYHSRVVRIMRPLLRASMLEVRYEDICRHPRQTMQGVFDFLGVQYEDVFFKPGRHHLIGSRATHTFDGKIRESLKWKEQLSSEDQDKCLKLTRPWSERYGYI